MTHATSPFILLPPAARTSFRRQLGWALGSLLAMTVFLFGSEGASYALIPGVRAPSLTIPLDDPLPFEVRSEAADDSAAPSLPMTVAEAPLPATEAAEGPLSISARFDTGAAAPAVAFKGSSALDDSRAQLCLTSAIYYEAASESEDGQRAVAQVVLNRVRHPAWPSTVCGVIYQGSDMPGCQFSYACDGSMARVPLASAWATAARIAREALSGHVYAPVGLATFYHTLKVNPIWNRNFIITSVTGNHIFYRLPGGKGEPQAYAARYTGREPLPGPLPRKAPWPPTQWAQAAPNQAVPANALIASGAKRFVAVRDDGRYVAGALPESDVLPQYRDSGRWLGN